MSNTYIKDNLQYDPDTGDVSFKKRGRGRQVGKPIRGIHSNGYYTVSLGQVGYKGYAHRVAWFLHYGDWPDGQIDHINRDRTDNRICNLRDVDPNTNQRNRSNWTPNTGVRFRKDRQRWQAYIHIDNRFKSLGHFGCETAAKMTRRIKEEELGYVV